MIPSHACTSQGEALLLLTQLTALLPPLPTQPSFHPPPLSYLMPPRRRGGHDTEPVVAAAAASYPPSSSTPCSSTITIMSSSSRKISSESFSSSVGSDCGLESPGRDGSLEATEENRGCPFSSFTSSHRSVIWNGRSSNDKPAFPAVEEQGPVGSQKRVTRRRRVNLDSLGESLRRLTSPMVGLSSSII